MKYDVSKKSKKWKWQCFNQKKQGMKTGIVSLTYQYTLYIIYYKTHF